MKRIVCEMCNGTDLEKSDGMFICQSCGTKYSIEEAKKLMVEVEGAVKIDNSDFVQRYLENARRAKSKEDWDEVEKYYNMVEQYDPANIEAIFYSAYGKAKSSLTNNDIYKRQAIFKSLNNSVSILDDNYDIEKEAELKNILEAITADIKSMFFSTFVYTQTKNGYGNVTGDNKTETYQLFINLACEMVTTLTNIINKFPEERRSNIVYIYKLRLDMADLLGFSKNVSFESRKRWLTNAKGYAEEIQKLDPSFTPGKYDEIIAKEEKANKTATTAGCIVAVCFVVILAVIIGVAIGLS